MKKYFIFVIFVIISTIFIKYCSFYGSRIQDTIALKSQNLQKSDLTEQLDHDNIKIDKKNNIFSSIILTKSLTENIIIPPDRREDIRGQEDENGVRHDVNLWINNQLIADSQKLALFQQAKIIQKIIVAAEYLTKLDIETARKETSKLALESLKASDCVYKNFNFEEDPFKYSNDLEKLILNTKNRKEASEIVDKAFSGGTIFYPEGETCEN